MRQRLHVTPRLLAGALALAACGERTTAPAAAPIAAPTGAPATARAPGMEGYARTGPTRSGWIRGRTGRPLEVRYEIQHGLAVWEGDIVLGPAASIATSAEALRRPQGAPGVGYGVYIDGNGFRWPGGVVPYEIAGDLPNQARVTDAIAHIEQNTAGVRLVPRNGESDYIRFVTSDGCSSPIGRQGGQQNVNLADDCSTGNTIHEIVHALGLYHEHTRCDRDGFVEIKLDNIIEEKKFNFDRQCDDATDEGEYDEGSIMHYGAFFFAIDESKPTIVSKRGRDAQMGQRAGLGPTDVATINFLYGANNQAPTAAIAPLAASYPEGGTVSLDGSGSSDPDDAVLTYQWTFGDGATATGATPTHVYADNGSYTVTLTVSDGFLTNQTSRTVTVTNVAPTVSAGPPASRAEGSVFSRGGTFADPGADVWTATVDYGDGSGVQPLALSGKSFQLNHVYADDGAYTITVRVTDDDAGQGPGTVAMTITNVAPTVAPLPNLVVTSGDPIDVSATFSDPGVLDAPWSWRLNWGFGSAATGSTNDQSAPITASRLACAAGTYAASLAVTDKDDGTGTRGFTITVPHRAVGIDIRPGGTPNPVNLSSRGVIPVAVLSTPTFDATTVNPATVMLGDGIGSDVPVAVQPNGRRQVHVKDVNGDGRPDLVVMFDTPRLVSAGELTAGTTSLVLRAFLGDACTNVRGEDAVVVRP